METELELAERQKRQAVFVRAPEVVLVKILAMGPIAGLARKERDNAAMNTAHAAEAVERKLEPMAYQRAVPDTGLCLFKKEEWVRVGHLLEELAREGFRFAGGHFVPDQNGKGPVNTLEFRKDGKAALPMPPAVVNVLKWRFNHATVWLNLRHRAEGEGQFRLDTVNLAKGLKVDGPGRELIMKGNTYELVVPLGQLAPEDRPRYIKRSS